MPVSDQEFNQLVQRVTRLESRSGAMRRRLRAVFRMLSAMATNGRLPKSAKAELDRAASEADSDQS